MIKKAVFLVIFLIVASVGALFAYTLLERASQATLSIALTDKQHSPFNTVVSVGEQVLSPKGGGGSIYTYQGRSGSVQVDISGPAVGTQSFNIEIQSGEETRLEPALIYLSSEDIVQNAISGSLEGGSLQNSIVSQDELWVYAVFNLDSGETISTVYLYSFESNDWTIIAEGTDIDVNQIESAGAPYDFIIQLRSIL